MCKSLPLASHKHARREGSTTTPKANQSNPVEQLLFVTKNERHHQWGFGGMVALQLSTGSLRWTHHSNAFDEALGSRTSSMHYTTSW